MELGLQGTVAFVAGASQGLGKAIALGLAQEGCKVALCSRRAEELAKSPRRSRARPAGLPLWWPPMLRNRTR